MGLRITSALLGILVAALMAELALWAAGTTPHTHVVFHGKYQLSDNPVLGYELQPGARDGSRTISRAGLRDREYPPRKPDNVFRIAVIGDSVTFGFVLPQAWTYPKQLEMLLNRYAEADAPVYEVLNLGVTGYNITQSVENLRVRGLRFEPDLVIYGYVLNDPQAFSLEAEALAALRRRADEDLIENPPRAGLPLLRSSRLFALITTLTRTRRVLQDLPHLVDPGFQAYYTNTHLTFLRELHAGDEPWARVCDGLSALADATSKPRRIPVLVAVFPIDEQNGFTAYPLRPLHDQVVNEARRNGLSAMDLTPSLRAASVAVEEDLYVDFLHPSVAGSHVVAMALLKWLADSGHLPAGGVNFKRVEKGREVDAEVAAALASIPPP